MLSSLLVNLAEGQVRSIYTIAWWTHILLVVGFFAYIPSSKHMHLVVSPFNNFFRSLQPKGSLPAADVDSSEALGAGEFNQFQWKHLLDPFSCTQCGRCLEFCPSYLSGGPLAPHGSDLRSVISITPPRPRPKKIARDAGASPADKMAAMMGFGGSAPKKRTQSSTGGGPESLTEEIIDFLKEKGSLA